VGVVACLRYLRWLVPVVVSMFTLGVGCYPDSRLTVCTPAVEGVVSLWRLPSGNGDVALLGRSSM
jgi:hypothetical protein